MAGFKGSTAWLHWCVVAEHPEGLLAGEGHSAKLISSRPPPATSRREEQCQCQQLWPFRQRDRQGQGRVYCGVAWLQWIFLPLWGKALSALQFCGLSANSAPRLWDRRFRGFGVRQRGDRRFSEGQDVMISVLASYENEFSFVPRRRCLGRLLRACGRLDLREGQCGSPYSRRTGQSWVSLRCARPSCTSSSPTP